MLSIVQISDWPAAGIEPLVRDSQEEGFRFLQRLKDEYLSGANRFSAKGEALFGIIEDEQLLAVGGINRQSDDCGRLRRFYVKKDARRKGIGRMLAQHILRFASDHYSRVTLRTDTEAADRFYLALGFSSPLPGNGSTHIIELKNASKHPPC
jgi:GNAT superfamily N-acetyltransferase